MSASEPVPVSDQDLLQGWVERHDEPALRLLFERHRASIRSVARRLLRDADLANDVVQEVYIKLFTHGQTITGSIDGWLRAVAGNQALIHLRSQTRRKNRETNVSRNLPRETTLESDSGPLDEMVAACVAALTPAERDLIVQIFWVGQTQKDIALQHAVSAVHLHKRARAALGNLRRMIEKRGIRVGSLAVLLSLTRLAGSEARTGAWIMTSTLTSSALIVGAAVVAGLGIVVAMLFSVVDGPGTLTPAVLSHQSSSAPRWADLSALSLPDASAHPVQTIPEQPPFWLKPVALGWEPSEYSSWKHFSWSPGLVRVQTDDPRVQRIGGPEGMEIRYRSSEPMIAAIAVQIAPDIGYQIHCEIRTAVGNDFTPWQPRLISALRLAIQGSGDFFVMLCPPLGDSTPSTSLPTQFKWCEQDAQGHLVTIAQGRPGANLLHLCAVDRSISIVPWKFWLGAQDSAEVTNTRPLESALGQRIISPSAASATFPVFLTRNSDLRHVVFRALTPAERDVLIALVKRSIASVIPTADVEW